ncbi:hypothetical protein K1719_032588 [Acacia pycnantha]|nr:hypothetical protein K1719_032588 [Acacia pycnantha]
MTSRQGLMGKKVIAISNQHLEQAHLHNSKQIDEYAGIHMDELRRENSNSVQIWYAKEHNKQFIAWLKQHMDDKYNVDHNLVPKKLMFLAHDPNNHVLSFSRYVINGYTFYTKK